MAASGEGDRTAQTEARFAWLAVGFGSWIFAALIFWVWALDETVADVVFSPYHVPFYLGIVSLVGIAAVLAVRAVRSGRAWHQAFPRGFGSLGAGAIVLVAWPIVDVGWRLGVGIEGIENFAAPSRLLVFIGIILISVAPLRAGLGSVRPVTYRVPIAISAALVFSMLGGFAGYSPAASPWLEVADTGHEDDGELWVMNADGSMQTRLIEAADGFIAGPASWSPDGSQIAYTWLRRPATYVEAEDIDIWIAAADGSNRRPVVQGVGWHWIPHWSPDGAWIVYTVDPPRGFGNAGIDAPAFGFGQGPGAGQPARVAPPVDIWRIRADGTGAPVQLTDDPSDDRAGAYSPDGRRLLFDSTREAGRTGVYLMNADGSGIVRATFLGDDWGASWSPDGKRIAFNSSPTPAPSDIYVIDVHADGSPIAGPPVRLTDDPDSDNAPNWSPDGSRIAFVSDRGGELEIWSMAADGTDLRNLTRTPGAAETLMLGGQAWGPDGRILYQRAGDPRAQASGLVREDLAIGVALLVAMLLSTVVITAIRLGAPFGTVAMILGMHTVVIAVDNGEWRFVPAAIVLGLAVDVAVRFAPVRFKAAVAGAGAPAGLIIAITLTVLATSAMGWSPTLTFGVVLLAAALGWGLSGVIARPATVEGRAADA